MVRSIKIFVFCVCTVSFCWGQTVSTLTESIPGGSGGVCVNKAGNIYVADFGNKLGTGYIPGDKVFKVTPEGEVSVFATGLFGASGNAFDSQGNLLQSNIAANSISKIAPDGTVTPFANIGFASPVSIVIDEDDNLYVCNCGNNTIRKVTPNGVSTQFAASAILSCPNGITRDNDGNFYVSNFNNGIVAKITPDGQFVSVFVTIPGNNNGHITFANGELWVAARGANQIWRVSLDGQATHVAGNGIRRVADGPALQASFGSPNDLAFDSTGTILYVNDVLNAPSQDILTPMVVRKIVFENPTSVQNSGKRLPQIFALHQNYPNPFNPTTEIRFDLIAAGYTQLRVYNLAGQEEYFYGYKPSAFHTTRSAGKSITNALVGIAIDRQFIPNENSAVYPYFSKYDTFQNWNEEKNNILIKHLLTMSSGLACNDFGDSPGNEDRMQSQKEQPDWTKFILDLPLENRPGEKAFYCSGGVNLLGDLITQASDLWIPEFCKNTFLTRWGSKTII